MGCKILNPSGNALTGVGQGSGIFKRSCENPQYRMATVNGNVSDSPPEGTINSQGSNYSNAQSPLSHLITQAGQVDSMTQDGMDSSGSLPKHSQQQQIISPSKDLFKSLTPLKDTEEVKWENSVWRSCVWFTL